MNLREVLDNLSEQSSLGEHLLSSRERELLSNIWRYAKNHSGGEVVERIEAVLASAVGQTVMQRASDAIGRGVLGEIKEQFCWQADVEPTATRIVLNSPPPPATGPRPPAPAPGPGSGRSRVECQVSLGTPRPPSPGTGPRPPVPSGPKPGGGVGVSAQPEHRPVALEHRPEILRAECVVLDEFLAPGELQQVSRYALAHENDFRISEVISPGVTGVVIDAEYRRSRVLMDLGRPAEVILDRIQSALPRVLEKLGMDPFPITRVESQITASNHGDFFRHHSDNAEEEIASRQLTYVYFFHREPKAFEGGELRLYDAYRENGGWFSTGSYKAVVPEQNQIAFFPSSLLHEITPVVCPSQSFADSRFTVNGWLHR
jgi:Rps23 Pro-64 3,4-dihydroxylase Tpa1-like proline 4-hydroxylase